MFNDDYELAANSALTKVSFLKKDNLGYFISSMFAGFLVGCGMMLIYTIAGVMEGSPGMKIIQGVSFTMPLSLIVIAGCDLFTGNNFTMAAGVLKKRITVIDGLILWVVCYLGNFAGSIFGGAIFNYTGLAYGATLKAMNAAIIYKTSPDALQLFCRGVMCNIFVCAGVWCSYRAKSEAGKLIMIFWCMYAFIICGYEHCVANMTLFAIGVISPAMENISVNAMANNLIFVTLGNIAGGVLLALIYYFIARSQAKQPVKKNR